VPFKSIKVCLLILAKKPLQDQLGLPLILGTSLKQSICTRIPYKSLVVGVST
jgi:hypothetical protein